MGRSDPGTINEPRWLWHRDVTDTFGEACVNCNRVEPWWIWGAVVTNAIAHACDSPDRNQRGRVRRLIVIRTIASDGCEFSHDEPGWVWGFVVAHTFAFRHVQPGRVRRVAITDTVNKPIACSCNASSTCTYVYGPRCEQASREEGIESARCANADHERAAIAGASCT